MVSMSSIVSLLRDAEVELRMTNTMEFEDGDVIALTRSMRRNCDDCWVDLCMLWVETEAQD